MAKFRALIQTPPPPRGESEQQIAELRDYLYTIVEELGYILTHLEAEDIDDGVWERIQSMLPKPYAGLPPMDGEASGGTSAEYARGNHQHPTDTSLVPKSRKVNGHALSDDVTVTKGDVGLENVANERQYSAQNPPPVPTPGDIGAIPATAKGSAGGVAELDSSGRVPSAQLPSYVDDVLNYPTLADFPVTGESGKIYVAEDTNRQYRWSGSAYVEISESLALGETSSTAYRGDRGKTAYDHSQVTSGNPHQVTAAEVGAIPATEKGTASGVASLGSDGKVPSGQLPAIPTQATATPLMDGLGYVGDSAKYAKEDHVHPTDTSKANFDTEIIVVNMGTVSSLPKTVSNAKITADHVVIQAELGTPAAQTGDWTVTTSAGSVTLSGTISGSTTVTLVLGNSGGTVS